MIAALIVAAGQGIRMGATQRKQYLALAGQPILVHTLKAFDASPDVERIVLVVPGEEIEYCRQRIVAGAQISTDMLLVPGGARRQDSVRNGLQRIDDDQGIVLIHDGVRPLVFPRLIAACIQGVQRWEACIPAVEVSDTLKQTDAAGVITRTVPREGLQMAQTPQGFRLALIREAHRRALQEGWQATDDASLVERMGVAVHTILGDRANIKITTPEDLRWAEIFFALKDRGERLA
ncbi:MAG: 2-C-methyl-D-erythritol 4-phosphate cytidylyltransferase [Desulfatitalea sp.]